MKNQRVFSNSSTNFLLNKHANNPIVQKLTVNNIDFEEPEGISKQFNKFFVEIGQETANNANSKTSNDNFRTYSKSVHSTIVLDPPILLKSIMQLIL